MKPILVFQTDFTYKESAVCAMYGAVKSVDRELEIVDGTHEIPQYDIWSASFRLTQYMRFWPVGTIFVSVVDPGVGTSRRACIAKTIDGYYVVTPDNGTLTHVKQDSGIAQVREIDERVNRLRGKGVDDANVFHGRDLFGFCAAKLASGLITYEQVGPEYPVDDIITLPVHRPKLEDGVITGIFEIGDPNYGNLWTNVPLSLFIEAGFTYGDLLCLKIQHDEQVLFDQRVLFHRSFGYAKKGDVIIYNNELMKISVAINQGSFSEQYKVNFGAGWEVEFKKSDLTLPVS